MSAGKTREPRPQLTVLKRIAKTMMNIYTLAQAYRYYYTDAAEIAFDDDSERTLELQHVVTPVDCFYENVIDVLLFELVVYAPKERQVMVTERELRVYTDAGDYWYDGVEVEVKDTSWGTCTFYLPPLSPTDTAFFALNKDLLDKISSSPPFGKDHVLLLQRILSREEKLRFYGEELATILEPSSDSDAVVSYKVETTIPGVIRLGIEDYEVGLDAVVHTPHGSIKVEADTRDIVRLIRQTVPRTHHRDLLVYLRRIEDALKIGLATYEVFWELYGKPRP